MGIKTNLQAFLDPEFGGYIGYPDTPENPSKPETEWTNAIQPEIALFLAPSAAGFFVDGGSSNFQLAAGDFIGTLDNPNPLADAIDQLMEDVADGMTDASDSGGGPTPITPPSDALDSLNTIFQPAPDFHTSDTAFTPEEICQRAEDRILEWLGTGMFTAWYVAPGSPPTGFPGIPMSWGAPSVGTPEPEEFDADGDGYKITDDPPDPNDDDADDPEEQ